MIADIALAIVFIVGFASIGITALIVGCYGIDQARQSWTERRDQRRIIANETVAEAQARARSEARRDADIVAAQERHPSGRRGRK
jgi:hypothetical protein